MQSVATFFAFILVLLILGVVTVWFLLIYNVLVKREENVNQAWAQIQVQFQRKLDLIPALLDVVKSYAQHENQTYKDVAQIRSEAEEMIKSTAQEQVRLSNEKLEKLIQLQGVLRSALSKLFALVENYPDLKANENFLTIQRQLEETEDRIAKAREIYNQRVRSYNAFLRGFPGNLVGTLLGFSQKAYFETEGGLS